MIDFKSLADLSAALLTPIIGVVTTLILFNQYRLERRRWRLELYEKRYTVYRATMDYIATMMRKGKTTPDMQAAFLEGTRDRALLFNSEVQELLDKLWKTSIDLEVHQYTLLDLPSGKERTKHLQEAGEIKTQLPDLGIKAQKIFGEYLKLTEK